MQSSKEEFIQIYQELIHRDGAEELLEFLLHKCDFFQAPASTRYHLACEGGLCAHSVNVYRCLEDYLARPRVQELYGLNVSSETAAIVALLHDVCKIDTYIPGTRNVKNEKTGQWEKVPTFYFEDTMPYGHGEKSVYIISAFMRLTREEAMAIRWHMAFSGEEDKRNISKAMEMYPLVLAVSIADQEASMYIEKETP